ncbi:MAG: proline--tRNA ligase [Rickettsiales bacterium]
MRLSRAFAPLIKENPAEASIASHRLMLRAGLVRQSASGIYHWLPMGLRALRNVERVVREEMDAAGALEILTPVIQPAALWEESGRYDGYGKEMLRMTDRHEVAMLFGPTAEESVCDLFRKNVKSYKQLPINLYQISWKFRDEVRPRFGVMRGREFLMKDAYSFDVDKDAARHTYYAMFRAYMRAFSRLGLCAVPVRADNGAIGGDLSHEFQILAETGESTVYYDAAVDDVIAGRVALERDEDLLQYYAAADEMHDPATCPVPKERLRAKRGVEVGHIFYFGTKYTEAMKAAVQGADGALFYPHMGSYGIGVSRLVGAIIEANHDDSGIIWPAAAAPYDVGVVNLRASDESCRTTADAIYEKITALGKSALYDDTDAPAGQKMASMDMIGLPLQVRVGPKKLGEGMVEIKNRCTGEVRDVPSGDFSWLG